MKVTALTMAEIITAAMSAYILYLPKRNGMNFMTAVAETPTGQNGTRLIMMKTKNKI